MGFKKWGIKGKSEGIKGAFFKSFYGCPFTKKSIQFLQRKWEHETLLVLGIRMRSCNLNDVLERSLDVNNSFLKTFGFSFDSFLCFLKLNLLAVSLIDAV